MSEKNKGGWKTQGRGKHTIKPLPKNGFGPPHLWYVSPPPPFVFALLFSLEETGTDQANPTLWGLQNWFWRAHSMVRFPPQNRTIRFPPPPAAFQQCVPRGSLHHERRDRRLCFWCCPPRLIPHRHRCPSNNVTRKAHEALILLLSICLNQWKPNHGRRICRAWKPGPGPQSSAEPLGFCRTFLQQVVTMRNVLPNLPQRFCRILGHLWEPWPVFSGPANSSPKSGSVGWCRDPCHMDHAS